LHWELSVLLPAKYSPKHEQDFVSHLEELRRRLIVSILAFFAVAIVAYFFSHQILDFLIAPLRRHQDVDLFFHKPYEAFLTHLKVAALTGIVFSSPVFLTQLWLFIAPGLFDKEKKISIPLILISIVLFCAGALFAYTLVIPFGLHFLLSFQTESLKPLLGIGPYFSFLIGMILAFGVLFDFPVFLIGLIQLGVVSTATVARSRKVIILMIFIVAAILTPSPDPISQLLLAGPLLILFEVSLVISRFIERRRR